MLLARILAGVLLALWPVMAQAQAQPVQVEAVPDFDMFNLDSVGNDAISLPGVEPLDPLELESVEVVTPERPSADPCRHFTPEERKRLPTLCGPAD
jgi:hypothetical protein